VSASCTPDSGVDAVDPPTVIGSTLSTRLYHSNITPVDAVDPCAGVQITRVDTVDPLKLIGSTLSTRAPVSKSLGSTPSTHPNHSGRRCRPAQITRVDAVDPPKSLGSMLSTHLWARVDTTVDPPHAPRPTLLTRSICIGRHHQPGASEIYHIEHPTNISYIDHKSIDLSNIYRSPIEHL
jgi:hypothetical protein